MERFRERHASRILGVLSGFDRLLFRGTLRSICYVNGLDIFLSSHHVLYKNFGAFVEKLSARLKTHAQALAAQHGRPFEYLASAAESKEDRARAIMTRDAITKGLVCVLSCVEPCATFALRKDALTRHLHLMAAPRKCLHLYFYFVDRDFGLMHVRLQTWLPMTIQVCVNGREYLARQMDRAGIGYEQRDNCFVRIDDLPRAQALLDRLTTRRWPRFLNALARRVNPWLAPTSGLSLRDYYWTMRQSEYATDVLFTDAAALREVYPHLLRHALQHFHAEDVLRFLGRRTSSRFNGQVTSNTRRRSEGVRIKHWVEENSIKMYDKEGSVLRIETTINQTRRFRVRRWTTRKGQRRLGWLPLRQGVADLPRRVEISRAANQRYLQALAMVGLPQPVAQLLDPISRRVVRDGRPYRPLRPLTPSEAAVFRVVLNGAFHVQGFRNPDLRLALWPTSQRDPQERRRASGRATRWLRLLRAHGLIRKVSGTRYYRVSEQGHRLMTTALNLRETDLARLAA
jgi:hypothetical protein